jgi:hypothetical protein
MEMLSDAKRWPDDSLGPCKDYSGAMTVVLGTSGDGKLVSSVSRSHWGWETCSVTWERY